MKRAGVILLGSAFALLLAVCGFLYVRTQAINTETRNQVITALRELKQLDAEWNVDILKARAGMHNNYDPLSAPLAHVRALREYLAKRVKMAHGGLLQTTLERVEAAFVAKEDLVEQFKSQNAVLQNSLRYFPSATRELKALLASMPASEQLERLDSVTDQLLVDILRFNLLPEARLGERIAAALEGIEAGQDDYPAALAEPLGLLARHARIALHQRVVEDALMTRIADMPTARSIDELSETLDQAFRGMLEDRQRYRNYLLIYSGFLLVLLTYAAWRLLHSYQTIAQVNRHLQTANETLEQRVSARTAELEQQSAQLKELATHDMLTGLINRRHLMDRLTETLQRAARHKRVVALLFIDLDGFKAINDTYGHAVGDRALQQVAERIARHVRKEDAFARLGGDEFVILLHEAAVAEGAIRVAQAVLRELSGLTQIDGHAAQISASIGISSMRDGADLQEAPETLLNQADQAMYRAKQQGKNGYCLSEPNAWQS